jgi:type I restriction enzyme S subunit
MNIPAAHPGFRHTAAGVIPADWDVRTIGELFEVSAGGDWDTKNSAKFQSKDFPYPVYANALTNRGIQGYCRYWTVPGDSLTITGRGDVGKAIYRPGPFVPIVRLLALVPKRASAKFYAEYINSRHRFALESTGVPQLTAPQVRPQVVAVPPVDEQRAIASTLRDVESLIDALERLIAKKQAIKQGMMQQLLTGAIRLPGFTTSWISGPLKIFMPLQRGFDLPTSKVIPGKYPVVYSNGIARTHAVAMAKGPGVITGRSGTIGKVHYVEEDYWPHNTSLWVTSFARSDAKFVYYFLTYIGLQRFSSGSGVPTLNRNDAHGFHVTLPADINEQIAIAAALTDADREIGILHGRLIRARAIKQGMMQELLTGRTRLPVAEAAS